MAVSPQELQKMAYLFELLQNQQNMLHEQIELLEKQIAGVSLSKTTMEGMKDLQEGHEIIIPIGTTAFTKAKLIDPKNIILSVGDNIFIEKDLDSGIKSIEGLIENYKGIREKLYAQLEDVESKIEQIRPQMEELYQRMPESKK